MRATDELVVVRCKLGEQDAFHALVERWHGPVWTFVRRMIGDGARSDDLTQEVWVRVVRGLPRLEQPDRFPAWVFTLARRVVLDELRRAYRQPDTEEHAEADDVHIGAQDQEFGRLLDRLEMDRALALLTPGDRAAVVLFHLHDLPLADVAEILALPAGTVKSRLHRARRQLHEHLRDRGLSQ